MTPLVRVMQHPRENSLIGVVHTYTEEGSMDNAPQAPQTDNEEFSPVGTLVFVMCMLLGFVVYWGYIWFLVVIERGGN